MAAIGLPMVAGQMLGATAAGAEQPNRSAEKFNPLRGMLRSPSMYRDASGRPGPEYWQQKADYDIDVTLDEDEKRIIGSEVITYTNRAPYDLNYLWVQLDQNRFRDDSLARRSETAQTAGSRRDSAGAGDSLSYGALRRQQAFEDREFGHEIKKVALKGGGDLPYTVVDTNMRIDLKEPLETGETISFRIDWAFNIIEETKIGGRGGFEHFKKNDTYIYFLAQWFPRMAALTDYTGWQNKPFLGRGEFTLEFGDYDVAITVPEDHVVSATGVLQNPDKVLSKTQRARLKKARTADKPVFVVTPEEALENEKDKKGGSRTWHFSAENVRDFSWSSSRKFIWDAMGHKQPGAEHETVMAMSFYPHEAEPIWSKYSTHAVVHTMDVYSEFSFDYPYPTAQSVNTWARGGMEYPMITFNGYRPTDQEKAGDRTYSRRIKYGLIGVIIHEIGHIYFPMTVNSDERRWTWMDEGFNTFLEYLAELRWEEDFPAWTAVESSAVGGKHYNFKPNVLDYIGRYMTSENQVPIMTQSDSIQQFGPNAYSKPAAAFTVLRETVMGRELFDFAFKEYARRWKFKRPTPEDFFRTMEDASGVDLDWFWKGWFFSTDHVDAGITDVRSYKVSSLDPNVEFPLERKRDTALEPESLQQKRNLDEGIEMRVERYPELKDFYNKNDEYTVTPADVNTYNAYLKKLDQWERDVLKRAVEEDKTLYFVDLVNKGGLVTPLPLTITYANGDTEELMIPAEIWRRDDRAVTKLLIREREIASIELDRHHQTADADFGNNHFPPKITRNRLELYKSRSADRDMMKRMLEELEGNHKTDSNARQVPLSAGR
ncbi:M1 family metallopeptidase [Yunchengibacter salinarum]|uniref:M1 family metallopeptidase n=1 Tax=Yunchengibacter salinarum TaxID=3133399 RepID=UPI004044C2C8